MTGPSIVRAQPNAVEAALKRAMSEKESRAPVIEMLQRRVPIHFGGMSDPFQPAEKKWRVTRSYLQALSKCQYPVVISTKGVIAGDQEYRDLYRSIGSVVIQFSFCSTIDSLARKAEPRSMAPTRLLATMESLASEGFIVTCRWQPYIAGLSESPRRFIETVARAGARHVALEHLKVPLEQSESPKEPGRDTFLAEQKSRYLGLGALRDGREYILPPAQKVALALEVKELCHEMGMSFGAADNELQYLSDSEACCSGVDRFPGFENVFRYNIGCAIRRAAGGDITLESIANEWRPRGSVDRYLNSKSRLTTRLGVKGTVEDHVRYRWNDPRAVGNPLSFFRVRQTSRLSSRGDAIFDWDEN